MVYSHTYVYVLVCARPRVRACVYFCMCCVGLLYRTILRKRMRLGLRMIEVWWYLTDVNQNYIRPTNVVTYLSTKVNRSPLSSFEYVCADWRTDMAPNTACHLHDIFLNLAANAMCVKLCNKARGVHATYKLDDTEVGTGLVCLQIPHKLSACSTFILCL